MGLGPPILALYQQLKRVGVFDGITDVVELGAQGVWCPDRRLLDGLFEAFGRPVPPDEELAPYINATGTGVASSRHLHERLGLRYECLDIDASFGALTLDLNFDELPEGFRNRSGLTTNHGTTEHILNQHNCFKLMHELTRPGGCMLHALPFTVHLEHGFFNYQPSLFATLARLNRYETIGIWLGPDWTLSSLVPWEARLLEFLVLNARTTHLLLVVQRKVHDSEFVAPAQGECDPMPAAFSSLPYQLVVDGEYYSGHRFTHVALGAGASPAEKPVRLDDYPAKDLARSLAKRVLRRVKRALS